jgi:hypothetical protein
MTPIRICFIKDERGSGEFKLWCFVKSVVRCVVL